MDPEKLQRIERMGLGPVWQLRSRAATPTSNDADVVPDHEPDHRVGQRRGQLVPDVEPSAGRGGCGARRPDDDHHGDGVSERGGQRV